MPAFAWRRHGGSPLHRPPLSEFLGGRILHDLGRCSSRSRVLAYVNFSQYLIVWSGNLPISWYLARFAEAGDGGLAVLLFLRRAVPSALARPIANRGSSPRATMLVVMNS
jgi:hypothetical protein